MRSSWACASCSCASACDCSALAVSRASSKGRGSMTKSRSPFATSWPSVKLTEFEIAADPRAHLDRFQRLELSGEIVPFLHLFDERLRDGDSWRRRLGLSLRRASARSPSSDRTAPLRQWRAGEGRSGPKPRPGVPVRFRPERARRAPAPRPYARSGRRLPLRFSFMTASLCAWRLRALWHLPSGQPGETLQNGGGEGETEWPNASDIRQRPSLQSLPPAAFPQGLPLRQMPHISVLFGASVS